MACEAERPGTLIRQEATGSPDSSEASLYQFEKNANLSFRIMASNV
jgi:hypothetical protein